MARIALMATFLAVHCVDDLFGHDQAEECKVLIACCEKLVPGTGKSMEASYGPNGVCWKSSEAVEACTKACDQAMLGLKANPAFHATPECRPESPPKPTTHTGPVE